VAVERAAALGEDDQADAVVERGARAAIEFLGLRRRRILADGDIAEAAHHPAVGGNAEMRFEFEAAQELRNGRINDEGVENIDVVRDKQRRTPGIEARRAAHLEFHPGDAQHVAEERALRPVVAPRIDKNSQQHQ
jgi:hypothetical protein